MNLPKKDFKIKISPYVIDVIYVKKCETFNKEKFVYGSWNQEKLRINLSTRYNSNPQQLENTFLHEILHAMFNTSGLDLLGKKSTEESACDRLAHSLQAFLHDNPKLFKC